MVNGPRGRHDVFIVEARRQSLWVRMRSGAWFPLETLSGKSFAVTPAIATPSSTISNQPTKKKARLCETRLIRVAEIEAYSHSVIV
jgi:hypothetical protein